MDEISFSFFPFFIFHFFWIACYILRSKPTYIISSIISPNQRERYPRHSIPQERFVVASLNSSGVQNKQTSPPPFPPFSPLTPYTTTKPHSDNPSSPNPNSTPQTYNFSPNTSHYPHYSNTSHPPPTPAISTEAVQV